ncbi:hypothetical protein BLA60_14690 [Actinophytocola xinjiangensis]|uniref:Winged helix DNA-binding protein n=1 Tax=Actinophytocola xinjiangensis TaxID=485602 RepID=A0A7Z0WMT7_9PSEU|nr:winged helix DNA-binding domain-containing protein [Actinophytocola xinjiangensis]OLF10452.1 hypothetical protein BLA60_14690 [Actinophytocola xinjiangensis]
MTTTVLSTRALNRATLARQLLVERAGLTALDAVHHLAGLQAQAPFPPYYALWSRLVDFDPAELAGALLERRVVRLALMRDTVHLVTAADAGYLRPLLQPLMDRGLRAADLTGLDLPAVAATARELLAARPHSAKELGAALAARWPEHAPAALVRAARGVLPLVQLPPRAVWGRSGQTVYQTARDWLGQDDHPAPDLAELVRRYLAAYGPATVADLRTWCGLTRLGQVADGMELLELTDEQGRRLLDLPEAPRPEPDLPVPVRFLPEFDNVLLSYADRTRIMSDPMRARFAAVPNGVFPATFLVDGFLRGAWRITRQGKAAAPAATLTITPWASVSTKDSRALVAEGERLLEFAAPQATTRRVVMAETG